MTAIDVILPLLWFAIVWWLIGRWSFLTPDGLSSTWIRGVFVLKVLAGVALWAIYTWYYPYRASSDALGYYDDAMVIHQTLFDQPMVWLRFMFGFGLDQPEVQNVFSEMKRWTSTYTYGIANDNPTIIRLNMLIALVSGGAYHVHTVLLNLLSLIGLVAVYRFIRGFCREKESLINPLIFAAVALSPTVLFWSSGVLKEAPLVLIIGLVLLFLQRALHGKPHYFIGLLPVVFVAFYLKPYVIVALLPPLLAYALSHFTRWSAWLRYPLICILSYGIALHADRFFPAGNLLYILHKKQTDFYNVAKMNDAGSAITISPVDQHAIGFLLDAPERLFTAYFRPTLFEIKGLFYILPAFENVLLMGVVLFILFTLLSAPQKRRMHIRAVPKELLWFTLTFAIVFGLILGSVVPVLGAVVRYKLPVVMLIFGIAATAIRVNQRSGPSLQE
jgi:hypothetical protein